MSGPLFDEDEGVVGDNVVMQPRCPACKADVCALSMWEFSHGHARCGCGYVSRVYLDRAQYAHALGDG